MNLHIKSAKHVKMNRTTVLPAKSDSEVVFCLQLSSRGRYFNEFHLHPYFVFESREDSGECALAQLDHTISTRI